LLRCTRTNLERFATPVVQSKQALASLDKGCSVVDHGDLLASYRNPRLLKRGGQKAAYRVTTSNGGDAVVKIGAYASPTSLERARREVDTLRSITSPYYPRQHDFQTAAGDRFIVTEEYIDSAPLADCMGRFTTPASAFGLIAHLVSGLRLLWDRRIVHRDVKPDNILVRPTGVPVIIDLGIARLLDADSLTVSHAMRGPCTPVYAAPEQLRNRKTAIDARTDQFALGIILVQLLLRGQHPFHPATAGGGDSIVQNILDGRWHRPVVTPPLPQRAIAFASTLLGREPHERYRTTDLLVAELNHVLGEVR
jgi:serine/threonine-protein kinase